MYLLQILKILEKLNNTHIKINKIDIIFEMYNNKLLTLERLEFIVENCTNYLNISSRLVKRLMKNNEVTFLDVIFSNLRFFDDEFIIQLLLCYFNEVPIPTLLQLISNKKFKISTHTKYTGDINKYLINECTKKHTNMQIIRYLVEHGADINKINKYGEVPLTYACRNGNILLVKCLVEHGADINKENNESKTPLFKACSNGNEAIVKYLVEHGADINKETSHGFTPLFEA